MCSNNNRCMCSGSNNYNSVSANNYSSYNNGLGGGYNSTNYNSTNMNYGYNNFVPVQPFNTIFSPANGLANGTMFTELVSSYCPNQSLEQMNYLKYNSNGGSCCR